ncbi:hypothetical protein HDV00_008225 [Rhizophlyctis rosea]|nr:hypothetical protein HDV00_008225 [Rhizophlyctis rosea]
MTSEAGPSRRRGRDAAEVPIKEENSGNGLPNPFLSERARGKLPDSQPQPSPENGRTSEHTLDDAEREFEHSRELENKSRESTQAYIEALKAKIRALETESEETSGDQRELKKINKILIDEEAYKTLADPWSGYFDRPAAIVDDEDGVTRCGRCNWEIVDGVCANCGALFNANGPFIDDEAEESDFADDDFVGEILSEEEGGDGDWADAESLEGFVVDEAEEMEEEMRLLEADRRANRERELREQLFGLSDGEESEEEGLPRYRDHVRRYREDSEPVYGGRDWEVRAPRIRHHRPEWTPEAERHTYHDDEDETPLFDHSDEEEERVIEARGRPAFSPTLEEEIFNDGSDWGDDEPVERVDWGSHRREEEDDVDSVEEEMAPRRVRNRGREEEDEEEEVSCRRVGNRRQEEEEDEEEVAPRRVEKRGRAEEEED